MLHVLYVQRMIHCNDSQVQVVLILCAKKDEEKYTDRVNIYDKIMGRLIISTKVPTINIITSYKLV